MTLEDFFTLTEMKNGLATPARVEELISIMKQQKDCVLTNVGDTARQWSGVASTLAATENQACLNHFVKSNGLCYLNHWLQEALKCSTDVGDNAVEELFSALLRLLERLPIRREDAIASGIQSSVEQLVGFKSLNVKEKARSLSERWKHSAENDMSCQDMNKDEKCEDDALKSCGDIGTVDGMNSTPRLVDKSAYGDEPEENNSKAECSGAECTESPQRDYTSDLLTLARKQIISDASLKSAFSNANSENMNVLPSASDEKDDSAQVMKMEVDTKGGSPSESAQKETYKGASASGLFASSIVHKPERSISCSFDAKDAKETLPRSASIDCVVPKYWKNMDLKPDLQDLLCNGSKLRIKDGLETSLDNNEESGSDSEVRGLCSDTEVSFGRVSPHDSPKQEEKKLTLGMDQSSELGLEYGEIDALEVARQVAIEVEREVVDYREPFCSSSPESNSNDRQDQPGNDEQNGRESSSVKVLDDASSPKDNNLITSETDTGPDKSGHVVEMPKPTTNESGDKTVQNKCAFDLNEDLSIEESDCFPTSHPNNSINVSAPIAVAASKGAPFLPVSPIRFEGELGWKGSAATSAFRPASPRKTPDAEKTSSGHKRKRKANLIEIDLNIADSGDDAIDLLSVKPVPVLSREDSLEVSSKRADRFKLDLNQLGDEDRFQDRAMSPAASCSSSKQPVTRDFDLNDSPAITIMGSKITDWKDYMSEAPQPAMPYGHFPIPGYPYNGPMLGPSMPFPPPIYGAHGSFPYMVDSQGTAVVPQILSTTGINAASSSIQSMPSFFLSMANTSPGLNGAGSSQSGSDLNLKNFFSQGHSALTEEEPCTLGFNQVTSWQ